MKIRFISVLTLFLVSLVCAFQDTPQVRRTSTAPEFKSTFDAAFAKAVPAPKGSDLYRLFDEKLEPRMGSNDNGEAVKLGTYVLDPKPDAAYVKIAFYDKTDAGGALLESQWGYEVKKYTKANLPFYFKRPANALSIVVTWVVVRGDKSWHISCTLNPDGWGTS